MALTFGEIGDKLDYKLKGTTSLAIILDSICKPFLTIFPSSLVARAVFVNR